MSPPNESSPASGCDPLGRASQNLNPCEEEGSMPHATAHHDHLTARQLDGVDCDRCGAPLDRAGVVSVPTGYVDGYMVFRCGQCIEPGEDAEAAR